MATHRYTEADIEAISTFLDDYSEHLSDKQQELLGAIFGLATAQTPVPSGAAPSAVAALTEIPSGTVRWTAEVVVSGSAGTVGQQFTKAFTKTDPHVASHHIAMKVCRIDTDDDSTDTGTDTDTDTDTDGSGQDDE